MSKENIVEIPSGSGNRYRYVYEDGATKYLGPVGSAPDLAEEEFMLQTSTEPANITGITFKPGWEGRSADPDRERAKREGGIHFDDLRDGEKWLRNHAWQMSPDDIGYNKHDFIVTFSDGETYEGRIDIKPRQFINIGKHMKDTVEFQAGLAKPIHLSDEQYQNYLAKTEKYNPGLIDASKEFLENREFV